MSDLPEGHTWDFSKLSADGFWRFMAMSQQDYGLAFVKTADGDWVECRRGGVVTDVAVTD